MDTVTGNLKVYSDKHNIYGRGACDTKSSIASMIIASEGLIRQGVTDFGLLFDACEETDFSGIKRALKIIPASVKTIVVGEPTGLDLIHGQKGILVFKLIARGKSAHGSTPELGINAIEKLMSGLIKLKAINFPTSPLGANNLNIGKILGGTADNIVPDYAEAEIAIRISVECSKILSILKNNLLDLEIVPVIECDPVLNQTTSDIANSIEVKERTVSYFTEMYFLSKKAKVFVLGPGDSKYAHTANEQIEKGQLDLAVKKYSKIINLLNK
jgi:acetylornithine deacetylase